MRNLHPIMILGAYIDLLVTLYGGEQVTQKNPLGFMAFFCVSIIMPIASIIIILHYNVYFHI